MSRSDDDPLNLDRLTNLAGAAVEAALKAGADGADAVAAASQSLHVSVRHSEVEETERAEATDIGLRVFVGKKSALVGFGAAADSTQSAERAVAMAKVAPVDETQGLAPADLLAKAPDASGLELDDGQMPDMDALTHRAHNLEHAMLAVAGVTKSGGVSASAVASARALVTSEGFRGAHRGSRHGHHGTAIAGDGTRMERDGWASTRRHLSDLTDVKEVGEEAGHRAVRRLEAEQLSTRTATIIFEPRAATGFVSHILSAANGVAIARKTSILADKMGERILAEGITLRDDPCLVRGMASRPFDGEGLASAPLDIVADGVLSAFVLDLATARKLGRESNGRAARGTGLPSPSATNISVLGGRGTLQSLMDDAGSGLLITDLIGMGANIVSGNYSRGAAGFWFENGEIVHPVSEVTVAGMLPDMFARAIFADDAPGLFAVDAPSVAIEGMTIGGR